MDMASQDYTDYQIALSPDLGITPEEFDSAWNGDPDARDLGRGSRFLAVWFVIGACIVHRTAGRDSRALASERATLQDAPGRPGEMDASLDRGRRKRPHHPFAQPPPLQARQ